MHCYWGAMTRTARGQIAKDAGEVPRVESPRHGSPRVSITILMLVGPGRPRVAHNARMPIIAQIAAVVSALVHAWFFVLESIVFSRPSVAGRFGVRTPEQIEAVRPMAFNQGFYNLFLAIGVVGGLALLASGSGDAGRAIVLFACACMAGAGLVLAVSPPPALGSQATTHRSAISSLTPSPSKRCLRPSRRAA